ncbi:MAG: hypothetical protein ABII79_04955 [bacterium]
MDIIQLANERVRKLNIFDVKLVQGAAMCVMLILVKLIPQIVTISIWWFVVFCVICALRPCYVFFLKK